MPKIPQEEHNRRMEIFKQGGSCVEMAKKLYISHSVMHRWIRSNNLLYDRPKGNFLSQEEHDRRMAVYETGATLPEMVKTLGLHPEGLRKWMRDKKLPSRAPIRRKIKVSNNIILWDSRDHKVGRDKKKRSYVNGRPEHERKLVKHFMNILLTANDEGDVDVRGVMKDYSNGIYGDYM